MTKKIQFWLGLAAIIAGCFLYAANHGRRALDPTLINVPDWKSLPKSPPGTVAVDAQHTGTLWFDGKDWRLVAGSCGDIFEIRLKVTPERHFVEGRIEPLLTTGAKEAANLVCLVTHANGDLQIGADIWGLEMKTGPVFRDAGGQFFLNLSIDGVNNRIRATVDGIDGVVYESGRKPWSIGGVPWFVGYNPFGGSYVSEKFSGAIAIEPRIPLSDLGGMMAGSAYLRVLFSPAGTGHGQPLLTTGTNGRADFFYVVVMDPTHLRFGFDHWGARGSTSPAIEFDPRVPHLIVVNSGSLGALKGSAEATDSSYEVTMDGREVLRGSASFFPASAREIFIGSDPVGGSLSERDFIGKIVEKGISY